MSNLSIASLNSTSVTLRWIPQFDRFEPNTSVHIEFSDGNSLLNVETSDTVIIIDNLVPSTTYTFDVYAISSTGSSVKNTIKVMTFSNGMFYSFL